MNLDLEELIRHVHYNEKLLALLNAELAPLESGLFENQLNFINDPSTRISAICSRRAGKTYGVAVRLLRSLYSSVEADCAYSGLTRGHAKKVMFNHLLANKRKFGLKLKENRSDLTFNCLKTGNTLYITGAQNEQDTEKLRGLKLKDIVLDEAASFKSHINYLIDDVLEPTTIDVNGTIAMIGTPSANPLEENIFYRVTQGIEKGWAVHKWTILDNPYIPHAATWLEDYRQRKGWEYNNPIFMREWLGLWTVDKSSLVFKYDKAKQDYDKLPEGHDYKYIMGVDLGFDDAFAIVVLAFSYSLPNHVFCVDEYKKEGLIPEKMAHQIISFKEKYNPTAIVADTGGLGKAIVEEFKFRYKLNIEKADKKDKLAFIEIVNGDLQSGILKIKDSSELAKEMKTHQWDPESDKQKEDDRTDNHLNDSLLYSYKKAKHYLASKKEDIPKAGTEAYYAREAESILKKQIELLQKQNEDLDYE